MHRPCILVVDDDPMVRELISRRFERDHYAVCTAADMSACRHILASEHPDIVLLDASMPDCTPEEIIHIVRATPATRSTPIILLAEQAAPSSNGNGNGNGNSNGNGNGNNPAMGPASAAHGGGGDPGDPELMIEVCAKPFSSDMLVAKVRTVLDHHSDTP